MKKIFCLLLIFSFTTGALYIEEPPEIILETELGYIQLAGGGGIAVDCATIAIPIIQSTSLYMRKKACNTIQRECNNNPEIVIKVVRSLNPGAELTIDQLLKLINRQKDIELINTQKQYNEKKEQKSRNVPLRGEPSGYIREPVQIPFGVPVYEVDSFSSGYQNRSTNISEPQQLDQRSFNLGNEINPFGDGLGDGALEMEIIITPGGGGGCANCMPVKRK